jgi:GTP cyclohydrolase I
MASNDKELGARINRMLMEKGLETPFDGEGLKQVDQQCREVTHQFASIMDTLGLDRTDDSLMDTPKRVAKMFCEEIFYGLDYANFPKCTVVDNKMQYNEMVQGKCSVKSMCEHHFVPFIGIAHVAYLPDKKVLGLSKFNRVVDFFCRRPQIQERLTEQVSAALRLILETDDVAVVIQAKHFCVHLRGVQDSVSDTTTSKLSGKFRSVPELRAEFLALARNG